MAVEDDEELSGGRLENEELADAEIEDDDRVADEDAPGKRGGEDETDEEEDGPRARAPWHFKILLVGTVGYLLYRLYQGIGWLVHHA